MLYSDATVYAFAKASQTAEFLSVAFNASVPHLMMSAFKSAPISAEYSQSFCKTAGRFAFMAFFIKNLA